MSNKQYHSGTGHNIARDLINNLNIPKSLEVAIISFLFLFLLGGGFIIYKNYFVKESRYEVLFDSFNFNIQTEYIIQQLGQPLKIENDKTYIYSFDKFDTKFSFNDKNQLEFIQYYNLKDLKGKVKIPYLSKYENIFLNDLVLNNLIDLPPMFNFRGDYDNYIDFDFGELSFRGTWSCDSNGQKNDNEDLIGKQLVIEAISKVNSQEKQEELMDKFLELEKDQSLYYKPKRLKTSSEDFQFKMAKNGFAISIDTFNNLTYNSARTTGLRFPILSHSRKDKNYKLFQHIKPELDNEENATAFSQVKDLPNKWWEKPENLKLIEMTDLSDIRNEFINSLRMFPIQSFIIRLENNSASGINFSSLNCEPM